MVTITSPIIDYYPKKFKTDLNGKQHEWEAVVLIPFIEEVSFCISARHVKDFTWIQGHVHSCMSFF